MKEREKTDLEGKEGGPQVWYSSYGERGSSCVRKKR